MKSNTFAERAGAAERRPMQILLTLLKALIAAGLLAMLFYWGNIDLSSLPSVLNSPATVVAVAGLTLSTVPISALRWWLILRSLNVPVGFKALFHIQCIGMACNQILFGPASADAVRGVYAWRAVRDSAGRITVSIFADRLFGLAGLLAVSGVFMLTRLDRIQQVPQLAALLFPLLIAIAAFGAAGIAVLIAPRLLRRVRQAFAHYPRVAALLGRGEDVLRAFRRNPLSLIVAFALTILVHLMGISALVLLAYQLRIGSMSVADYFTATPLAYVANALPLTPGGIGVGEAAFDRICHWLEPVRTAAPYASIFFAYRAITTVLFLTGFISFVFYKPNAKR